MAFTRRRGRHRWPDDAPPQLRELFEAFRERAAVRRGDVRQAILGALSERPMHGYQVIQELEAQSGGRWRPSAGSVYPTLQLLEDEGLVRSELVEGRRTYSLTDEGRAAAARGPHRMPWDQPDAADESGDIRRLAIQLIAAAVQVKRMGSEDANTAARRLLVETRRQMYGLLAAEDGDRA
jgi:DNA-binding PadR family transcriptional regulator